jgi:hypothetical protein
VGVTPAGVHETTALQQSSECRLHHVTPDGHYVQFTAGRRVPQRPSGVAEEDDDGVIDVDDEPGVRTASLATVSAAVVVALAGSSSVARRGGLDAANSVQSVAVSPIAMRDRAPDRDAGMSERFSKKCHELSGLALLPFTAAQPGSRPHQKGVHDEHHR